jgi:hypothetical protein
MRYLCLVYLNEKDLDAMPADERSKLDARHLDCNDALRRSGHYIEAEALAPVATTACVRIRGGKPVVTDGPFAGTREQVAGFYLIAARDLNEAIQVAARLPAAPLGTVEVRAVRPLTVDAVAA